jgi:cytochrome c biogenesis protein CcmG/thiol:disulfide interchange protein DsbE
MLPAFLRGVLFLFLACTVALFVFALTRPPRKDVDPLSLKSAPPFVLPLLSGGEVDSRTFLGKPILLNFWATWCSACKEEVEELKKIYVRLGSRIHLLGVAVRDEVPLLTSFVERYGVPFPIVLDSRGEVAIAYGITGVPETFLLNPEGVILKRWRGPVTFEEVEKVLHSYFPSL